MSVDQSGNSETLLLRTANCRASLARGTSLSQKTQIRVLPSVYRPAITCSTS